MKKRIFSLLLCLVMLFCAVPTVAFAAGDVSIDATNFPDRQFRTAVSGKYDTNGDGKLSGGEISAVKEMDISQLYIKNLKGIEFFTAIESLICPYNFDLKTMDLSKNTNLKRLECEGCALESLDLSKNTKLETLFCPNNKLTELNLKNNTKLSYLSCGGNMLPFIDLGANTALKTVHADNNVYPIGVDTDGYYDYTWIPGFDDNKVINLSGAYFDDVYFVIRQGFKQVTYDYNCGGDRFIKFTLDIKTPAYWNGSVACWEKVGIAKDYWFMFNKGATVVEDIEYIGNVTSYDCTALLEKYGTGDDYNFIVAPSKSSTGFPFAHFESSNMTYIAKPVVSPAEAALSKGESLQFGVTGTHELDKQVKWTVAGAVAQGTTISERGVLTVASDESSAQLTVTATSTVDTSKSTSVTVTLGEVIRDYTLILYEGKLYKDYDLSDSDFGEVISYPGISSAATANGYKYTLNNVNFTTTAVTAMNFKDLNVTIDVKGENVIKCNNLNAEETKGIFADSEPWGKDVSVTIVGDGTLKAVAGAQPKHGSDSFGICVWGNLNIADDRVTVESAGAEEYSFNTYGIYVTKQFNISAGTVNAECGPAYGRAVALYVSFTGSLNVTGGQVFANGNYSNSYVNGIDTPHMTVTGGHVTGHAGNTDGRDSCGVYVEYTLTIGGEGTVLGFGGDCDELSVGVLADNIVVNGGTLDGHGGKSDRNSYGVYALCYYDTDGGIKVTEGNVYAEGGEGAQSSAGVSVNQNGMFNIIGGHTVLCGNTAASTIVPTTGENGASSVMKLTAGNTPNGDGAAAISTWKGDGSDDIGAYKYMEFEPNSFYATVSGTFKSEGSGTITIALLETGVDVTEHYFESTSATGNYTIENVPNGLYTMKVWKAGHITGVYTVDVNTETVKQNIQIYKPTNILGDVDSDGKVTMRDVIAARKYVSGILNDDEVNLYGLQVMNGEGASMQDVICIRRYTVGIIGKFPVE